MTLSSIDWPSTPEGVRNAHTFDDAELNQLIDDVSDGDSPVWFSKITPPDKPPQMEELPKIVQQDILEDHKNNLNAAPEDPTKSYRKKVLQYLISMRDARNTVRPESLTSLSDLPTGITRKTTENWVFYGVTDEMVSREDDIEYSAAEVTDGGKYLFFTPDDTGVLESIIFEQFTTRPFESAKVPTTVNLQEEIVLCLYYEDDRYKQELRHTYQNEEDPLHIASLYEPDSPIIKPRGYKLGR